MLTEEFIKAIPIIEKIEQHNHQAYFVGGCVRDLLLNQPIQDVDIATSAPPQVIQNIFENVIPVGIEHGTVIVRHQKTSYEVTTFRVEGDYSDQRHPDSVEFISRIDEDLKRRDFTMNALAMDRHGKIIDLFNGQQDIKNKLIRTVGDGKERFMEDPLRIIRGLRFASQLGFAIEEKTLVAMIALKHEIEAIAIERITSELSKLFAGTYIQNGLHYLVQSKIYEHLPLIKDSQKIIDILPSLKQPFTSLSEVLAFFHTKDPTISLKTWITQWKCSRKIKQEAEHLIQACTYYKQQGLDAWLVYQLPDELFASFANFMYHVEGCECFTEETLITLKQSLPIQSRRDMAISGHELMDMFPHQKRGPWIQTTLEAIEKQIVFHQLDNQLEAIKEWIKCNPPAIN